LATGTNPLDFDGPNSCPRIQNPPVKKPMTRHEFNFLPKPMPVGLTGTHGWPVLVNSSAGLQHRQVKSSTIQYEY